MIAGYKEKGKKYFLHGNRNRKPKHALTEDFKNFIIDLYLSKYWDCTFTLFSELLATRENIYLSVDEVRVLLTKEYILSPRSQKSTRRRFKKDLLAMQQKAKTKLKKLKSKGSIIGAYFDKEETLNGYYHVTKQIFTKYGIPYKFKTEELFLSIKEKALLY